MLNSAIYFHFDQTSLKLISHILTTTTGGQGELPYADDDDDVVCSRPSYPTLLLAQQWHNGTQRGLVGWHRGPKHKEPICPFTKSGRHSWAWTQKKKWSIHGLLFA